MSRSFVGSSRMSTFGPGHEQPHEREPAALAAGQVAHERPRALAAEPEALGQHPGGELARRRRASRGRGSPPPPRARAGGPARPRCPATGTRAARSRRAAPRRRRARRSPASSRTSVVLPEPFTPTSATRSPGPSRHVTCRSSGRSPKASDTSSASSTLSPRRALAKRSSSARVARLGHVGDERVGGLDAELRLRGPRGRPATQPGELLAHEHPAALVADGGDAVALRAGEDVGRVAALVLVHARRR